MKILKLSKWTVCVERDCKTVQQQNMLVVLDNDKNFVVLFSVDDKCNLLIEKCSKPYQCEINYENKRVLLEKV